MMYGKAYIIISNP